LLLNYLLTTALSLTGCLCHERTASNAVLGIYEDPKLVQVKRVWNLLRPYEIPLFQELRDLLERLKVQYPNAGPTDKVLPTASLLTVLTSACKALNIAHLSRHDLRHVFATRCIEKGVDIPTVAAWLGHKDNGRTVMLVYGHLRQEPSQAQAADMKFL
jgi:integrase